MISILLTIAVLGLVAYLVKTLIPMNPPFDTLFNVVLVIIAVMLILRAFGGGALF